MQPRSYFCRPRWGIATMRRYLETSGAADETTVQLLCREHVMPLSVDVLCLHCQRESGSESMEHEHNNTLTLSLSRPLPLPLPLLPRSRSLSLPFSACLCVSCFYVSVPGTHTPKSRNTVAPTRSHTDTPTQQHTIPLTHRCTNIQCTARAPRTDAHEHRQTDSECYSVLCVHVLMFSADAFCIGMEV